MCECANNETGFNLNDNNKSTGSVSDSIIMMINPSNHLEWSDYMDLVVCSFGLLTVSVNVKTFLNLELKDPTFRYLLVEAIADWTYLATLISVPFVYSSQFTLFSRLYSILIDDYLSSCLAINNILIELFISAQRLSIILNYQLLKRAPFKLTASIIACVSLLYYSPVLFLKHIIATTNGFELEETLFGQTECGRVFPVALSTLRLLLVTVCLSSVNILCLLKFRLYVTRKQNMMMKTTQAISRSNFTS
jgi:hypothetical protein